MAFIRFMIDGAVSKPAYDALPAATKTAMRDYMRQLKALCSKINDREDTVKFKWHVCHHDEPGNTIPCVEQDI